MNPAARILVGFVASAVLSATGNALGGEPATSYADLLTLSWTAPVECPDQASVEKQVAELLGNSLPSGAVHVQAIARVWLGEDATWHVEIKTQTGSAAGIRRVDGESCLAISEATSLILAVAVAPDAVAARIAQESPAGETHDVADIPATVEHVVPENGVEPRSPVALPEMPGRATPVHGSIAVVAGHDFGTMPSSTMWYGFEVAGFRGNHRVDARILLFTGQSVYLSEPATVGGDFDLTAGALAYSYRILGKHPELHVRAGFEAGVFGSRGIGVSDPEKSSPFWFSFTPGALLRVPLGSIVSVRFEASAGVPLVRHRFDLDPYGRVYRASPVSGRLAAGFEATIF